MARRIPNLKQPSSVRPRGEEISPKTHPQETAAEEIGNRVFAFAARRRRRRARVAFRTAPSGFKEGLSSSFNCSNSGFPLCRFTTRKLTHRFDPWSHLALSRCWMPLFGRRMLSRRVFFPRIEFGFIKQSCRTDLFQSAILLPSCPPSNRKSKGSRHRKMFVKRAPHEPYSWNSGMLSLRVAFVPPRKSAAAGE